VTQNSVWAELMCFHHRETYTRTQTQVYVLFNLHKFSWVFVPLCLVWFFNLIVKIIYLNQYTIIHYTIFNLKAFYKSSCLISKLSQHLYYYYVLFIFLFYVFCSESLILEYSNYTMISFHSCNWDDLIYSVNTLKDLSQVCPTF